MQKLYRITIPGLSIKTDFPAVRHRLLADFPYVVDVLATTTPATVLVMYRGEDEIDAWLDAVSDSVATRRVSLGIGRVRAASFPDLQRDGEIVDLEAIFDTEKVLLSMKPQPAA